ncbi:probable pectinesterase/pectinesterase inhibitor 46 [Juglans microcarpa x Juglans regia]|uniref:probable pectinesterase/pectinesterase inhibitor 46 n=1 Tax=Juglans microcarpa x Juglans regia TaxID=2249226 RepID=UPI001B7E2711|nr:probable pectinesterase/pectinesterase inhibitor 46 [Juglans microcarpa x Juglans regia]
MMSMSSFRGYGKVEAAAKQARLEASWKTRKRVTVISISTIILVCVIVAAVLGTSQSSGGNSKRVGANSQFHSTVKAVCDITLYPSTCFDSLAPLAKSKDMQLEEVFKLATQVAKTELQRASQFFSEHSSFKGIIADIMTEVALEDCHQLLSLALDHLNSTLSSSSGTTSFSLLEAADDLKTWLCSAGTYLETCKDGFENANPTLKTNIVNWLKNSTELTSNSLAIISWISKVQSSLKLRRLMSFSEHHQVPEWLSPRDRQLLQSSDHLKKKAQIVVVKDGSGQYRNITAALKDVPDKSGKRFVIYVKEGIYYENVRVDKTKWNFVMIGDGMNATIVSGRLNFVDGTPTYSKATFAVFGKGFIARDMGFQNTAGAIKHQAVALMSNSDQSVFYRCFIDAFQDTLYAHANRQFYRECNITGTVDFIFGNSAVVLQNCNILPRVPLPGQKNTITAQGKFDPNQNSGISIQNCTISPYGDLSSVQTYLGRPWKNHSTTLYVGNLMGSFIDPSGWLPWTGTSAPDTIFYSEFQNYGPGSLTKDRVKWQGVKNITRKQASKFTVSSFIQGNRWISAAGVPYKSGL